MLGHTFRIQALNSTGVSVTIAVKARYIKFGSDGSRTDDSETTTFSSASVGTGAYSNGSTVDNSTTKWLGADLVATFTPATAPAANSTASLFLQRSTDGGTTWPDNGKGQFVGSVVFTASTATVTAGFVIR